MKHACKYEQDSIAPRGKAAYQRPEGEPGRAKDEHLLVAEEVTHAAPNENKRSSSQAVAGDDPGEHAGRGDIQAFANLPQDGNALAEAHLCCELSSAYDSDEDNLSGQRHVVPNPSGRTVVVLKIVDTPSTAASP